jgi:F-type H+-transporting ATPase subunit b
VKERVVEILKGIADSLHIELPVVLAQFVSFIILLFFMVKYAAPAIQGIMQQRQDTIANSLKNAEEQRMNAESLRQEYEGHLANIADEARAKMEQAMKDAEVARQRLLDTTQTEIQALHQRFESQKALEWEQLRRDLRNEMSDIAVLAASKALRSQLTPNLQSAVIDQVIHELDSAQGSIIN